MIPRRKKPFANMVGKRENVANQYFLLFVQCFERQKKIILATLELPFANKFYSAKVLSFGKGLIKCVNWRGHQTFPTVVSLKGRWPQMLQS